MKCPFCPKIEKKTEWYHETKDGIVVCKDLNNHGCKIKILIVGFGEFWHRKAAYYTIEEREKFERLGLKIANKLIKEKKAKKIEVIDMMQMKHTKHFHIQISLS